MVWSMAKGLNNMAIDAFANFKGVAGGRLPILGQVFYIIAIFLTFMLFRPALSFAGTCGNGKLEVGEECDDQNLYSKDGCSFECKLEAVPYTIRYVGIPGTNQPFSSLNTAYLAANTGDRIVILPGIYLENTLRSGSGGIQPHFLESLVLVRSPRGVITKISDHTSQWTQNPSQRLVHPRIPGYLMDHMCR